MSAKRSAKRPTRRRAFEYLRVSGKGQVRGDGFHRQHDTCARWAKANHVEIVAEYRDEGISGATDLDDRPGLAAMLDQLHADGVHLVLVERADRLARDLMISEILLSQFRDLGVTVVEASGGVDLTVGDSDPTRVLIRQVLAAFAQFEKSILVLKLRAARARIRRERGKCEGQKAFGERPSEQRVVDRMLALRRKRPNGRPMTYEVIAEQLNAENLPTRFGRPWQARTVFGVIRRHRRKPAKRPAQATPAS